MAIAKGISSAAKERHRLIDAIQSERKSSVITYFLGDRANAVAQVAEDAVRPMYEHLQKTGHAKRIDLFIYTRGGHIEVPWRIVTMMREYADELAVLVPYKALSAATLIALGADEIVMGRKGELGPIDPQLQIQRGDGSTAVQQQISTEDIMSYLRFLRDKAGLTDQMAIANATATLASKLDPWVLGQINRVHSHIRVVARKMLMGQSKRGIDEQKAKNVINALAQEVYQHGHAIGRNEAEEIGLNITRPSRRLESLMWKLFEAYEQKCKLREPIEPRTFVPIDKEEHSEQISMGHIESTALSHHFEAEYCGRTKRQSVPQLNLNLNLTLQLPPNLQPENIPPEMQQILQELMKQLQAQAQIAVQNEVRRQMPVIEFAGWTQNGAWRRATDWPAISRKKTRRKKAGSAQSSPR